MPKQQNRAVHREGRQNGGVIYIFPNRKFVQDTKLDDLPKKMDYDTPTTVTPLQLVPVPDSPHIQPGNITPPESIARNVASNVENGIINLDRAGKLDIPGLRDLLSQGIAELEKAVSAEQASANPPPTKAPFLWNKASGLTPAAFIQKHYGEWLGDKFGRAEIRKLDPELYTALSNWLRYNQLPEGMKLPTLKERTDRRIEQLRSESPTQFEEAGRLTWVLKSRNDRSRNRDR